MLFRTQPETVARIRYGEEDVSTQSVFQYIEHDPILVSDLAILSAEIYYRDEGIDIPQEMPEKFLHWDKLENLNPPPPPEKIWHVGGLGMEVWSTSHLNDTIAVLVFRGTRGIKKWQDWFANCRWLTKYIPFTWDQYDETHHVAQYIVQAIKKSFGDDVQIFSAGHSLGGGLAQHAGYSVQAIKTIYVFNTSPLTGFYSIPKSEREANAMDMRILRFYEHGEILAYFRLIMRFFYTLSYKNPSITELRFNFDRWDHFVKQHGMGKFALGLKKIAKTASNARP
ncbi:hypothetical protein A1359_20155 [Methylomonas lenta]|uniref:Fungal lipase-like domain-containing protein n=1 Tax=Methylomonas lenta TaxID=980561 RepID=A0A177NSS5_9GAMM|nr:hypothetical protein [Methylomonas lenta]OAI20912.1 hypothetical protein A1359_20155 [Methylomonas lenta]